MTTPILPVGQVQRPADSFSARSSQTSSNTTGASFEESMRSFDEGLERDIGASDWDKNQEISEQNRWSQGQEDHPQIADPLRLKKQKILRGKRPIQMNL